MSWQPISSIYRLDVATVAGEGSLVVMRGIMLAALSGVLATALTVPRASGEEAATERPAQSVMIDGEACRR